MHNSLLQFAVIAYIYTGFFKRDLSNLLKPDRGGTSLGSAGRPAAVQLAVSCAQERFVGRGVFYACTYMRGWIPALQIRATLKANLKNLAEDTPAHGEIATSNLGRC